MSFFKILISSLKIINMDMLVLQKYCLSNFDWKIFIWFFLLPNAELQISDDIS